MTPTQQPLQAVFFISIQPAVYRIGIAVFEEPFPGHRIGCLALGDLEDRRTPFSNIRPPIMIETLYQFLPLCSRQLQGSSLPHSLTPLLLR
jgi:hypothetical protein